MRLAAPLLALAPLVCAQRAAYPVRPGPQNVLNVEVDKTGFLSGRTHVFVVQRYSGSVEYDAAQPARSRVAIDAEAAGVSVSDTWLSRTEWRRVMEYAMSPAVLDALAHPAVAFRSEKIEAAGGNRYRVSGPLVIRGRSAACLLEAALTPGAGGALNVDGLTRFPMTRYGIQPFKEFWGLIGTRDEIRVRFQLHLLPEKP